LNIQRIYNLMPGADCSACFVPYCNSLARRVLLKLNEFEECPLLTSGRGRSESLEPLRSAASEGVWRLERRSIAIVGTRVAASLPTQDNVRPFDVIDIPRAKELLEGFLGAGSVKALPRLGVLRTKLEDRLFFISRDGRVLTVAERPPGMSALGILSKVLWGSVNLKGPTIPEHGPDSARVRIGGVQGGNTRRGSCERASVRSP
jgi:hypothetical protein